MPIIRTAHTQNYTITPNAVCNDSTLSLEAVGLWDYLISKPPHWCFNANAIKRKFNIGLNKVYRIMNELIRAGYATYQRIQSGTIWTIYDTPQIWPENTKTSTAPESIDRVNFECDQNGQVLERIESLEKNTTTPSPLPDRTDQQKDVVVSSDNENLIYPDQLNTDQKKACKSIIRKVKPVELQQDVLFELAYRMTLQKIRSVPGLLNTLVTAANNGTFTRTQAAGGKIPDTRRSDDTKKRMEAQRAADAKPRDHSLAKALFASLRGVAR